ncbi:MAG UNVERIFIED_CONTAM: STAS-like domain-containing protein [Paenibacillus polymyxa]|nr:STAS-like domain-containing protein [Paenibacillus polymyxa]
MKVLEMSQWGTALGSRDLGEKVRSELLRKMELQKQPIALSFDGVFVVSSSFAEECFGKLIAAIGPSQFKECFVITNLIDKNLKLILNKAVNKRLVKEHV